ncbi:peptide chain release factor N(5)-glutamine methyltransferase [bacterium]|nr:peptide chain release factor N(5)-glutamine methyltransferase [bacterium]
MTSAALNRTVRELLELTAGYLDQKGVTSARLNAERLLADVLGLTRLELFCQHDRPVLGAEVAKYRELVRRRAGGEPLQQILGETEFYGRPFKMEPGVFIPRPETERLVEACLKLLEPLRRADRLPAAVEIGCGSGAIGVSLACELPRLQVHASDVNPAAVALTLRNARALGAGARVHAVEGSRFDPLPASLRSQVDLLVSNPPYVRSGEIAALAVEVRDHDPPAALDGGPDGLKFYRAIASGMRDWLRPGGHVAVEIGDDQAAEVGAILAASGAVDVAVTKDYAGRDRVVTARVGEAEADDG